MTSLKQEISGIRQALRDTLEKGRAEYEAAVRQTRWGEGPIYIVGSGHAAVSGLTAAYAFESLLGWPVVVRSPAAFQAYTLPTLRPRSVVLAISSPGDSDEMIEAARAARSRGAALLVMSAQPASPLAQVAEGVFALRIGDPTELGLRWLVCQEAAIVLIALAAARIFKRHNQQADILSEEIDQLAEHVEWVYTQLSDASRWLGSEVRTMRHVWLVGGGFYHSTALHGAMLLRKLAGHRAQGVECSEFRPGETLGKDAGVIFLSGSRCRLRDRVHEAARRLWKTGPKTFSITDTNDGELARRSTGTMLVPMLGETVGSTLSLALLIEVAHQVAIQQEQKSERVAASNKTLSQKEEDRTG